MRKGIFDILKNVLQSRVATLFIFGTVFYSLLLTSSWGLERIGYIVLIVAYVIDAIVDDFEDAGWA